MIDKVITEKADYKERGEKKQEKTMKIVLKRTFSIILSL